VAITTYNNRLFPLPRQCSETDDGSSGTGRRKEESTEETDCEYQSDERGRMSADPQCGHLKRLGAARIFVPSKASGFIEMYLQSVPC
jgi:hypothetical protein